MDKNRSKKIGEQIERGDRGKLLQSMNFLLFIYTILNPQIAIKAFRVMTKINSKSRFGLLENSIMGNPLFAPTFEGNEIKKLSGSAGNYFACDFERRKHFQPERYLTQQGTITSFLPSDYDDRDFLSQDANVKTSLEEFDMRNIYDILRMDEKTLTQYMDIGVLKEVTYEDALINAGLLEGFKDLYHKSGLLNENIYQVTPKGNGLLFIMKRGGDKRRREEMSMSSSNIDDFIPAFN